jgi:hypothetical protein
VLRRIAPVIVYVAVFYTAFVSIRIQQQGVLWFVHIGKEFVTASNTSNTISPKLGVQSRVGYDGQYYFGLAADPVHARDYMGGRAGVVYSRVFYPALARATSLGSVKALPYAMLVINLIAVGAGTFAVGLWLRRRGVTPWWAVLFGLYPGLIFSVFRDLTEPLSFALAALGMLFLDAHNRRRLLVAGGFFALALLTRETTMPFALAGAAVLLLADRRAADTWRSWAVWRRPLAFVAATCGPLLVWRVIVQAVLGEPTQEVGHKSGWIVPLHGILSYWPFDASHWLIALTVTAPALLAAAGALVLLVRRTSPVVAGLLLVNVLLYVVFLPGEVYVDHPAASRAALGVVLASLYCLPAWLERGGLRLALAGAAAFVWSIAWYLVVASALGLSGLYYITT